MGEDKDKDRPISSSRGSRGPTPPHSRPSSGTHSKKSQDVKEDKDKDRPVTPMKSRPPSGPRPARDVTVNSGRDSDKERDRDRDGLPSVPRPRLHSDKTNSSRSICETDPPPPATERITSTSTPIRPPAIDPLALPTDDIPSLSPHAATRKPSVARMGTPVAKKN